MRKKKFVVNVLFMSSSMLIVRVLGMASNIYISALAGAAAMGLYHMIFSVFTFGITFASSGTGFAVTRLIAEEKAGEKEIIKNCLMISAVMSFVAFCFFYFGASFVGERLIRAEGGSEAVKILSFALPCMGASSVLRGYFIAKRHAGLITFSSIFEEVICILTTLCLLKFSSMKSHMCLVWGCALSNFCAFVCDSIVCLFCLGRETTSLKKSFFKDIFAICVPIAAGSYMRTALVAVENLMIPLQFERYGSADPIGEYGIIKAMAMPILLFPTVFIQAFSSMLVPEMSEMNAKGRPNGIRHVSQISLNTTTMFAFFISLMLFKHHEIIASSFFKESKVSSYLGMLSLLAIPMYLDTVADSILKGLNMQNASLKYNIIDSVLRLISIFTLMPKFGPVFYICLLYISEIFNLTLSLRKAAMVAKLKIDFWNMLIKPLICALISCLFDMPAIQAAVYIGLYFIL